MQSNSWEVLPEQFINRLSQMLSADDLKNVLESYTHMRRPTFRANTLKISADALETILSQQGFHLERVPWYTDAFILIDQPQKLLTATDLYSDGYFYVQSLSSMIPPIVMNPKEHERIGDITAAPGSKTTQMAAMMNNTGSIIANDISRIRLYKLQANLHIQGVTNTKTTQIAGQQFWYHYPEYFDKMLVDVPCSMEGRFLQEIQSHIRTGRRKK